MRRFPLPALLLLLVTAGAVASCEAACKGKGHAEVEGVLLPQADGVVEAAEGATLPIPEGTDTAAVPLPETDTVRLAVHREVPWGQVAGLLERARAAGMEPILLVGRRHHVFAFELEDELEQTEELIEVFTYTDGKVCVKPPDIQEALCAKQEGGRYIDRSYTRQFVREMRQRSHVEDVLVHLPPELPWADVVRAVDGARTCCGDEVVMRVALSDSESGTP